MYKRHQSGFTLLEVMVAMAVLAIAGMAVMGMLRETLGNSQYLADKRPAFWVAENAMTDIQLTKKWPPRLWKEERVKLGNKTWYVRSRSVETVSDDLRAIEVEVRTIKDDTKPALASLQSHLLKS
ncbi:type II secretion system minor pseudopilin GspI [Sansalvadorimonas sp. 2012CJ34-2]|uniref:Type II secretion system protein I n=1 Tax=Parendozoicomonas callyspongiae TaxID=2942213 RepID=A0ABT0PBH9_9GAMM|nr:type II secretion system minor pseudopilin GspI [Sansalvadorimonas sp. 2012CJ34-2]MCL6268743.1 type II secretion system minor pseudopilin GspI [Sansalvadorimonas sp. 2012CJ34-2]